MGDDTQFCGSRAAYDWMTANMPRFFMTPDEEKNVHTLSIPRGYGLCCDGLTAASGYIEFCSTHGTATPQSINVSRRLDKVFSNPVVSTVSVDHVTAVELFKAQASMSLVNYPETFNLDHDVHLVKQLKLYYDPSTRHKAELPKRVKAYIDENLYNFRERVSEVK